MILKKTTILTCLLCYTAAALTQTTPLKIWEIQEPTNQKDLGGPNVFGLMNEKNTFIYVSMPNAFRQEDFYFGANSLNKYDIEDGKKVGNISFFVNESIHSVKVDVLGNVYVLRIRYFKSPYNRAFLSKHSATGEQVWEKELYPDTENSCTFFNMSFDAQGRIILCGSHQYKEYFIFARCFRPDGLELWHTKIPTGQQVFDGYPSSSAAIINNKLTMFFKGNEMNVVEIDMNGNVVKQSLVLKADPISDMNKIMHTGEALQYSNYSSGSCHYKINKLDQNGNIVWERSLHTNTLTRFASFCNAEEDKFSDTDIYATCMLSDNTLVGGDTYLTKLTKTGQVMWQQRYKISDSTTIIIQDIAFDRQYVYVVGGTLFRRKSSVGLVHIYDKTNGQLVYSLQLKSNQPEPGYKILPIPGGFIYGGNRGVQAVIARYRLPTVSTTEAKPTNNINLYPNPTTRHLTIENIDKEQFNTAELWDSSGRLLLSSPVTDTTLHWQPEALPPGTYQVVLHGPGGRLAKQVVVMRDER
jgi:outer membrane protein assembly factor BamB